MNCQVRITHSAAMDIDALAAYLLEEAGTIVMEPVLNQLLSEIKTLSANPNPQRSSNSQDISALVDTPRKQLVIKPYRVIYQISGNQVFVEMVIDSRRDVKAAFSRRLQSGF